MPSWYGSCWLKWIPSLAAPVERGGGCTLARQCFAQALAALNPQPLLRTRLDAAPRSLTQDAVIALGKAAGSMLTAWLEAPPGPVSSVLLVRPHGAPGLPLDVLARWDKHLYVIVAAHPEPDASSLEAGAAALAAAHWCAAEPGQRRLVALISGGGSALMEVPLAGDLERLRWLNRQLVASGAGIGDINCIRKHRSAIKGGRLAAAAGAAAQQTWILSDVPPGAWSDVASGPTCPDATTQADFEAVWRRWLPGEPERYPETPKPGDAAFACAHWHCLADNRDACEALAAAARAAGRDPVVVDHAADELDEPAAADYLLGRWRKLRAAHPRAALVAGGEVRVHLQEGHGRGGRNQNLALRLALALEGSTNCFLSAGTDGVDGSSAAAGACVDGQTAARIRAAGLDPADHLGRQDAHPALAAAGALVRTGPTGNNLRDLRLFL
ncbi:MAG: glycerate kinase type-2 family protein [Terriglobales bacterium]